MIASIFIALYFVSYLASGQMHALWGDLECGSSVGGRFPYGSLYDYNYRYYTLTISHPTLLKRDVWISTCTKVEEQHDPGHTEYHYTAAYIEFELTSSRAYLRAADDPYGGAVETSSNYYWNADDECANGERGDIYMFSDVPEGEYVFGFYSIPNDLGDSNGGFYKLSVECRDPETPAPSDLASENVTETNHIDSVWQSRGSKKISCGASAFGYINSSDVWQLEEDDWYQYEVTSYAQEIKFTTCDPEALQLYGSTTPAEGGESLSAHYLELYYWDYDNREWHTQSATTYSAGSCVSLTIGDANDVPQSSSQILQLSPNKYYIGVRTYSGNGGNYVLSMMCWRNAAVATATAGVDYTVATSYPTSSPVTASPTTDYPTNSPIIPTNAPTPAPSDEFDGYYNNVPRKALERGEISCGIYQHDSLEKKRTHWYQFEVLSRLDYFNFDTCKDDVLKFTVCIKLYVLSSTGSWDTYPSWSTLQSSNPECGSICEVIYGYLPVGKYAIEIYSQSPADNYGEYILSMGCSEVGEVAPVSVTKEPTPSPTGVGPIPAKDGDIAGDITCGLTVTGSTSSRNGDFHKFEIVGGGIEWVKFDTCEATSFKNYLFIYDHYNHTGHEKFSQSEAYHYEDDSTCNEVEMYRLTPGVYYVNIDGYNYYFDHGSYTLTMKCSDNSKVSKASKFNEYKPDLKWWHILLIVLGCLLFCAIIGVIVFCVKKKKEGGDSGASSAPPPPQAAKSASGPGSGGGDGGEWED